MQYLGSPREIARWFNGISGSFFGDSDITRKKLVNTDAYSIGGAPICGASCGKGCLLPLQSMKGYIKQPRNAVHPEVIPGSNTNRSRY